MGLKIVFLAVLLLFASAITIAAMSFRISTPDKVRENMHPDSMVLDGGGVFTPCEPIDNDGGPQVK